MSWCIHNMHNKIYTGLLTLWTQQLHSNTVCEIGFHITFISCSWWPVFVIRVSQHTQNKYIMTSFNNWHKTIKNVLMYRNIKDSILTQIILNSVGINWLKYLSMFMLVEMIHYNLLWYYECYQLFIYTSNIQLAHNSETHCKYKVFICMDILSYQGCCLYSWHACKRAFPYLCGKQWHTESC